MRDYHFGPLESPNVFAARRVESVIWRIRDIHVLMFNLEP